jgi:elongation factor P
MQYLYADGEDYIFMDLASYDQIPVPAATIGEASNYLLPEAEVTVAVHENVPLYVELPTSVVLEITYTEPGLQGDRSTGGNKPATVETGATVMVPLFIVNGEKIKVDTRDGRYLGRA